MTAAESARADATRRRNRFKHDSEWRLLFRLACAWGMSAADVEATLSYDEWLDWIAFHGLYDLPDGFLVTGQLGALVAQVAGNRSAKPADFAPYFAPPPGTGPNNLRAAFDFLRNNVPGKRRQQERPESLVQPDPQTGGHQGSPGGSTDH